MSCCLIRIFVGHFLLLFLEKKLFFFKNRSKKRQKKTLIRQQELTLLIKQISLKGKIFKSSIRLKSGNLFFILPPNGKQIPQKGDHFFPQTLFFTTKKFFSKKKLLVLKNKAWEKKWSTFWGVFFFSFGVA